MISINQLVFEDFSKSELGFYNSGTDSERKSNTKIDIKNVQNFLDGKLNSSSQEDEIKSDKASSITGISSGVTHSMQKLSSNFGGINKILNKPDVNFDNPIAKSQKMKDVAIKKFNAVMGEKVL